MCFIYSCIPTDLYARQMGRVLGNGGAQKFKIKFSINQRAKEYFKVNYNSHERSSQSSMDEIMNVTQKDLIGSE